MRVRFIYDWFGRVGDDLFSGKFWKRIRETGWDLDPKLEVELERVRPVIIAQSVERTGRN